MKSALIILAVAVALCGFVVAQQKESAPPGENQKEIVAKLGEIVKARERMLETYQRMLKVGRAEFGNAAEIELAEARLALANEIGNKDEAINHLKEIVAAHEATIARFKGVARDHVGPNDLERAEISLLEAQVRLLRFGK